VLTDGQGDRPPGALELVGDLDPGRRGAHDQYTTLREQAGVAVVRSGHRSDSGGQLLG
jgi:hypothetical protein